MDAPVKKHYRHGNLPNAMRAAEEQFSTRTEYRRLGCARPRAGWISTAAYRHFANKEDLLASVAAEGFGELSAAMEAAMKERDPLIGLGLAYVEFALRKRGLFRLMFGPILAERARYPELNEAASTAFRYLQVTDAGEGRPRQEEPEAMAAWGSIHGLSALFIDGLVPEKTSRRWWNGSS